MWKCIFLGTSKGTIRVSVWPLVESNLKLEIIDEKSNKVFFKKPEFWEI